MRPHAGRAALAACALAFVAGTAAAQSNTVLYGLIDAAVEHYTNADADGHGLTRMPGLSGGIAPSRLGVRGSESLDNGFAAVFDLEAGFCPDTGASGQGNRLFGRQAWVGVAGPAGQLTIGRQYNALFTSMFDVDIFAGSQYGLGPLDPALPNARHDNSIAYKGVSGGVTLIATYSLGRDTSAAGGPAGTSCPGEAAGDHAACREWSAMLRYDAPAWAIVTAYDRIHGGPGAAMGLTNGTLTDSRLHVGAYVRRGAWKFSGGVLARRNEGSATPRSSLVYGGVTWRAAANVTVDVQASRLDIGDSANDARQALVRGTLALSKRTAVYAAAGRIVNGGASAVALSGGGSVGAGMTQTGVITGIQHAF